MTRLRVLAHVHMWPPMHNAGAELMLLAMLDELTARGWYADVIVRDCEHSYLTGRDDKIGVYPLRYADELYPIADVAITHLDETQHAASMSAKHRCPLVHVVHNPVQLSFHSVDPDDAALVIFNSEHLRDAYEWAGEQIVVRPPVDPTQYATVPGDSVTLVNLSTPKGTHIFHRLADEMPSVPFLGVLGAYGKQHYGLTFRSNVAYQPQTTNMRDEVYARTRVLLMPSDVESWGRCAVEAMASGIPVVASPTAGLVESLGHAGTFADRRNPVEWHRAVHRLLTNTAEYAEMSDRSLARSAELDDVRRSDLALFASTLTDVAKSGEPPRTPIAGEWRPPRIKRRTR